MAGGTTLIVTTRTGVRPLGVRGEPLHNSADQLRRVVRRRLGDAPASLLADPQPHDDGTAIDWYADWTGGVRRLDQLDPDRRARVLADVDRGLGEIAMLGDALSTSIDPDNTGLVGKSLKLAARRPAESFVYLVGDRPVVVAWGYETESAPGIVPAALVPAPRMSVLEPQQIAAAAAPAAAGIPWLRTLALALPLLLLLMGGSWLLRGCLPEDPALSVATREGPPAPPPQAAAPDPTPLLKASLSEHEARQQALQRELAMIDGELRRRVADCRPPEPPKPQVVEAPKPPPAGPAPRPPQVAARPAPPPPPPQPQRPPDDKLRIPAPTNDYSFMQGCWRTDPFQHERGYAPGVSTYCFDRNGNGRLEWRRGRTACRTSAQARFEGDILRLRDRDTTCNDRSHWYADSMVCRRGADNVALCSGTSQGGTFGQRVSWTVNLHKLD